MARMKNCRNTLRSRASVNKRNSVVRKRVSTGGKRRSVELPKSDVMKITTNQETPGESVSENNLEVIIPQTPKKPVCNDDTIDLIVSDDENAGNLTKVKECKSMKKDSSIVIDVCENSMTNDDIIIEHVSPAEDVQVLEILNNNNSVIDVSKDEDIQLVEKENDEIVILHANCKKVEEIQIIKQTKSISPKKVPNPIQSPFGIHKWKEKKKVMKLMTSNVTLNTSTDEDHFNAPAYKKRKRKSGGIVNKKNIENRMRKKFKKNKNLFLDSLTPKSKISAIGENVYSENPVNIPTSGLRPVIIDGSNVAFHHSGNRRFSCRGLEICINYFKEKGHIVAAFVPQFRVKANKCDNPKLLEKLVSQGDVILTPSRMVDGKPITSYDDRYIVQFAAVKGGVIVTRDNYNDLLGENPAWEETIKYRLLQFTWAHDLLMFPNDPLGIRGPNLDNFLRFS